MSSKARDLSKFPNEIPYDNTQSGLTATDVQDALDEVYSPYNILGTVSEDNGVPTGAVIERGSNANGQYTKFADGTMIAGRTRGGQFGASTWTFPVAFASLPVVTNSGTRTIQSGVGEGYGVIVPNGNSPTSTTGYNWLPHVLAGFGNQARFFSQQAFGRWF